MGIWRGPLKGGRRASPGGANGRRDSAISASAGLRRLQPRRTRPAETLFSRIMFPPGGEREALEGPARILRPVGPGHGRDQRLHVGDAGDALGVAARPLEAQRRAPVVDDENDVRAEVELVPQREQILALLGVSVAVGAGGGEL